MGLSRDAWGALGWGMDSPKPNHRAIFRAQGKQVLRKLLAEEPDDPPGFNDDEPPPQPSMTLPEWAESPWWCDLPRCPVCALADKGHL